MKKLALPLTVTIALLIVYEAVRIISPGVVNMGSYLYLLAALLIGLSVFVVRAISFVLFDIVFMKRKGREAPALLRGLLSTILYSVFLLLIYKKLLGQQLGGFEFIATSTVVSVIVGLALQDTLGNFFAGLSIHIEQPFHILDAIRIGDMLGRVEAVTWRTTAIRTNNNTVILLPNSKVAREPMEIYPFNNLNRRVFSFPAPYSIPPQRVFSIVRETVRTVPNVAPEKTPVVRISNFSDSSITYEVLYWVKDYMWIHDIDAKIREHIWYVYSRNQIDIPFPARHVLLERREPTARPQKQGYENVIASVDIFEPLTVEEREAVVKSLVKYSYAPGEAIIRTGDPGDSMFIICRGRVEVQLPSNNGNLKQVAVLEPGNFFGEMALLTGEPRNADVYALDEVEVLEIRKPVIQQLFSENAGLAEALSHKITERQVGLAEHSRAMSEDVKQAQKETVLRRIKRFFSLS
ncbi:MAG TPA: mechanosensitive ion channel family protein [Blastocatellia bacterium]|jgi:small-conductance mechanosensitive channel|nr:mechanosensitive ion channel family protein [Blastocatellia bacterium]